MKDTKEIIKFIKLCLKDEQFSKELINYLFSLYDLEQFINESNMNKLELASAFINHARAIQLAGENY